MALRQVASAANDTVSTSILAQFASTVAAGSAIFGFVSWGDATAANFKSVGDEKSGASSFTVVSTTVDATHNQSLGDFYLLNVTSSCSTITAQFGIAEGSRSFVIAEYTNISTVSALDVNNIRLVSAPGTAADAISTAAVTAASGDILISGVIDTLTGSLATVVGGTGYVIEASNSSATVHIKLEDKAGSGSVVGSWTDATNGATDTYIVGLMAFKSTLSTPSTGAYAEETGTARYLMEDGLGLYLIEPWGTVTTVSFPPFVIGDLNGVGSSGRFFRDRIS